MNFNVPLFKQGLKRFVVFVRLVVNFVFHFPAKARRRDSHPRRFRLR
jgi:hypothetical protein